MGENNNNNDVERSLGLILGKLEMMESSFNDHVRTIREDIRRAEKRSEANVKALEARINSRINNTNKRVAALEQADKENGKTLVKHSLVIGGVTSALTIGFIQLMKNVG